MIKNIFSLNDDNHRNKINIPQRMKQILQNTRKFSDKGSSKFKTCHQHQCIDFNSYHTILRIENVSTKEYHHETNIAKDETKQCKISQTDHINFKFYHFGLRMENNLPKLTITKIVWQR